MTPWILVTFGLLVVYVFLAHRRSSKRYRVECSNSWSHIDIQLERRHDLIPRLVETVRAALEHESDVLTRITEARAEAMASHGRQAPRAAGRGWCPKCHVSLSESRYEGAPVFTCSFCHGHLLRPGVVERIVSREEKEFSRDEIERARFWRSAQGDFDPMTLEFPDIKCPLCRAPTERMFHSTITRVVIDRCMDPACRAIWCDGGELDRIQILIEAARVGRVVSQVT